MSDTKKIISEHFSKLGKKGGEKLKKQKGPEYYRKLQKLSVESKKRKKKHGNKNN